MWGYHEEPDFDKIDEVFERGRAAQLDENNRLVAGSLLRDLHGAISYVGKHGYRQYEKEIWPYLKSEKEDLVVQAILTLGSTSRFHLPEFRDVAYDIWKNYEDTEEFNDSSFIRETALGVWCSYYKSTYDQDVLKILYKSLLVNKEVGFKKRAMIGMFEAFDSLKMLEKNGKVPRSVNWECINKLMSQYAPEVELKDLKELNMKELLEEYQYKEG
tara:strand:+ start:1686 stop:2330 length:645 start_codon:yes stop_codon:yes gene_type:complete